MKKTAAIILVVVLMLTSVIAYASYDLSTLSDSELISLSEAIEAEQDRRVQEKLDSTYLVSGNLGDYFIGLKSITFEEDWNGDIVAILTMDFSHTKSSSKTYFWNINTTIFQGGAECENSSQFSSDIRDAEIKPNVLVEITDAFVLWSKKPFDIEISQVFSLSDDKIQYTYDGKIPK